ncbi:hypothetical protein BCY90_15280 [Agrobacterium deltaense]|nr:hypothetical protein L901_17090 [Agrobacterium sp. D14]RKF29636.1 hypothetical protein BCY90_15280 [Agrobacterium deltaense]
MEAQRHLRPLLEGTIDLVRAKPYTSIDVGGVAKDAGGVFGNKLNLKGHVCEAGGLSLFLLPAGEKSVAAG